MTLDQMLEPGATDPALPVLATADRIALSLAISSRRQANDAEAVSLRDRLAIAAVGALSGGRLLDGREEHAANERNKIIRRLVRDAYIIADHALLERVK